MPRDLLWLAESGASADLLQIGEYLLLMLPGQHMRRFARLGVLGCGVDEGAAMEVRLARPGGDEVDVGLRPLRVGGRLHRRFHLHHELRVAQAQGRFDQMLLAGEMPVEGLLGDAGHLAQLLHPGGVEALAVEQAQRRLGDAVGCAHVSASQWFGRLYTDRLTCG
ncbi:hypothetical protein D3C78_1362940 [compost metagenome]